jgi:hypothetical protein
VVDATEKVAESFLHATRILSGGVEGTVSAGSADGGAVVTGATGAAESTVECIVNAAGVLVQGLYVKVGAGAAVASPVGTGGLGVTLVGVLG